MTPLTADESNALQPVACSCGRETYLTRSGEKYKALSALWKFRTLAEADEYERASGRHINVGWYCGEPDHEQAN